MQNRQPNYTFHEVCCKLKSLIYEVDVWVEKSGVLLARCSVFRVPCFLLARQLLSVRYFSLILTLPVDVGGTHVKISSDPPTRSYSHLRGSSQQTPLIQCCVNVWVASQTVVQHWFRIGSMSCGKKRTNGNGPLDVIMVIRLLSDVVLKLGLHVDFGPSLKQHCLNVVLASCVVSPARERARILVQVNDKS